MFTLILVLVVVLVASVSSSSSLRHEQYRLEYEAEKRVEAEAREHDAQASVDRALEQQLSARRICETGVTLLGFAEWAEPRHVTPERLAKTGQRLEARGWNVSMLLLNLSGTRDGWGCVATSPLLTTEADAVCLRNTQSMHGHNDTGKGLLFVPAHGDCAGVTTDVPVLRITMPTPSVDDILMDGAGEPAQYQRDCIAARQAVLVQTQQESDRYLARFFEQKRVPPRGETYISLLQWPAPLPVIEASVAAMRARDQWNMSLVRLSVAPHWHRFRVNGECRERTIVGHWHEGRCGTHLCTAPAPPGTASLSFVHDAYYLYTRDMVGQRQSVRDQFVDELLFECDGQTACDELDKEEDCKQQFIDVLYICQ